MKYLLQYMARAPGAISVLGGIFALKGAFEALGQDVSSTQFIVGQAKCAGGIAFAILMLWIGCRMLGDSAKQALINALIIVTPLILGVYILIHISLALTIWIVSLGTAFAFVLVIGLDVWRATAGNRSSRFGRYKSSWDKS